MALSDLSLGRFRLRRNGNRIIAANECCQKAWRKRIWSGDSRWAVPYFSWTWTGFELAAILCGLRLLAYQSRFLPDACRYIAASSGFRLWLVPLGSRPMGIQSIGSVGTNFPAGLLGPS